VTHGRSAVGVGPTAGWRDLAACSFVLLALAVTAFWHFVRDGALEVVDITHYQDLGERIAAGGLPFRDVAIEYPPGSMLGFVPPALVTDDHGLYYLVFAGLMAVLGLAAVVVTGALLGRLGATAATAHRRLLLIAISPLALGGVVLTRFDLLPVLVVAAALLGLVDGRDKLGCVLLGVAIAIKIYPLVVLPVVIGTAWRRHGPAAAARGLALALAAPVGAYTVFAAVAPGGVWDSLWSQLSRPLQIESLGAGVLLVVHQVAGTALSWSSGSGSQNLEGDAAAILATVSSVAGVVALIAVWAVSLRGEPTPERLVRFSAASVVAFVVFSKVLSPQYLLWLVFLVPLVVGPGSRLAVSLLAGAVVLTGIWFPGRYWDLVREFDPLGSWLVLGRGLLLLALLAALVLTDARRARPRLPLPVPSAHRS
jgi:Glycosyltransferase family 87